MYVETRARGRLFERPEEPRPFRITPRDLGLLANLARLRLASGEQLAALDGGSGQNVSRSLLALWEHEYVERLLGQVEKRVLYKGSFPLIYGLTRPGAWLLRKHGYDVRRRLLYETDKQRRAGWRFIEHRVDITEFMVRLELACRDRNDVELIAAQRYCRERAKDAARSARASDGKGCDRGQALNAFPSIPTNCSDCALPEKRSQLFHVRARPRRNAGAAASRKGRKPTTRKRC